MPDRPIDLYLRTQRVTDRELARLLLVAAEDAEKRILARAGNKISDKVTRAQLQLISAELRAQVVALWPNVDNVVRQGMLNAADAAAKAENLLTSTLYRAAGIPAAEMAAAVRQQARQGAENLYSRKLAGRDLSARVYRTSVGAQGMLQGTINKALAQGANWKRLAGDVKGLINPRVPGGVSYAAERLARTEMNNAFHETQKRSAISNPFIDAMKWNLSSSHPEGDVCDSLADDDHEGMGAGVFKKQNVPGKPHPNDLCYLTPEVVDEDEFVRKFHKGEYDKYLDNIVEDMPVDVSRAIAGKTDELANFIHKGRGEGKSWARIAEEAKEKGLSDTSSPGAMRAVARKHGISDTGPIKKGAKVVKDPPPLTRLPSPPNTWEKLKSGDVVEFEEFGAKRRYRLTEDPKRTSSGTIEVRGYRLSPKGDTIGYPKSRLLDEQTTLKKIEPKVKAPLGNVSKTVDAQFEEFAGWDKEYLQSIKVKYQELADQYDMRYPGVRGDLATDRRYGWLDDFRESYGIHEGMSNQIWLNEKFFSKHTIESARKEWKRSERSGWFSKTGNSQELGTFVHEFGHAVEKNLSSTQINNMFSKLFDYLEEQRPAGMLKTTYADIDKVSGLKVKPSLGRPDVYVRKWARVMERFRPEIQGQLSTYGTENWREFISEAFAEYKLSPKPRKIAMIVGRAIDESLVLVD